MNKYKVLDLLDKGLLQLAEEIKDLALSPQSNEEVFGPESSWLKGKNG